MPSSLGEMLRSLREDRNLTREQVAENTHIRLHFIKALEEDDRHLLPSAVQARGFLRVIAGYFNTSAQPLLDAWDGRFESAAAQPEGPVTPVEIHNQAEEAQSEDLAPAVSEAEPEPAEQPANEEEDDDSTLPLPGLEEANREEVSRAIFAEIGEELRSQREAVSLSLSDVERFTHVRVRYLRALEEGRMDDLPSPVQGRGMLSNYARFLDLDSERLLNRFADALQTRRMERIVAVEAPNKGGRPKRRTPAAEMASPARLAWRRWVTPDIMIGGALFLFFVAFSVWALAQITDISASAAVETPPSISEILQITPTPSLTPTLGLETEVSATAAPFDEEAGGEEVEPTSDGSSIPAADGTVSPVTAPPASENAAVQVYVVASQRAFLRIIADGREIFNARTTPGAAYTFTAKEKIELLTGNAGALQVFYQQQDLGTLGIIGQVASLVFTAEEVITPTPAATSTPRPTETPAQTLTPTVSGPTATITPFLP